MKLKLSRKLVIFAQSKDFVTVPWSRKVIIMESKVVHPSCRLLSRRFEENNCVNTSIKPILTGDKNPLLTVYVLFSTRQVSFLENHGEVSVVWLVAFET